MNERQLQWFFPAIVLLAGILVLLYGYLYPRIEKATAIRFLEHRGLHRLPKFDESTNMGELTRTCTVWANFTPTANTKFAAGQRFVSECSIAATQPKG